MSADGSAATAAAGDARALDTSSAFRFAIAAHFPAAILPDVIEPGRLHRFSTSGRRGDTAGWARLFSDLRAGVFGCFRTGIAETWAATPKAQMTQAERIALARKVMHAADEREREQREVRAAAARSIEALSAQCQPVTAGDPVALYLERRRIARWPLPQCLRLHPALDYWHEGERIGQYPAMVAPLVAPDGRTVALHRTWLRRDGAKAVVPSSAKKLGRAAGPVAGACIPLYRPARGTLGVAEGIESAMAANLASGLPTVAAYSAGNLAAWRWPAAVRRIVIFGDRDPAGVKAASELGERARRAGLVCRVLMPSDDGQDWADVWAAADQEAAA